MNKSIYLVAGLFNMVHRIYLNFNFKFIFRKKSSLSIILLITYIIDLIKYLNLEFTNLIITITIDAKQIIIICTICTIIIIISTYTLIKYYVM